MTGLPSPAATPGLGHLWRWTRDPVRLLADGARTGPVFRMRLWRPVLVGYRPEWNRAVLTDLDTFRSRGSLSGLTPYLSGGVVATDVPTHDARRAALNPHFHSRAVAGLPLRPVVERHLVAGPFEALDWSVRVVRRLLNAAFFGGRLSDDLLGRFLAPLHRRNPGPLLPRPSLFHRVDAEIARVLADPPDGTLAASLSTLDNSIEETRVALAAGFDTTAHTLAWALWHLAGAPEWRRPEHLPALLDEVLRLYPAGWLGSRVAHRSTTVAGVEVPAGTMVLYSPYLTHRDPDLWRDPARFRPERFADGRPAWGFIPFSAGRRTCLGGHLARRMLTAALEPFLDAPLVRLTGDATVESSITLRPRGPLWLARAAPAAGTPAAGLG
jgi:cytochrome P450